MAGVTDSSLTSGNVRARNESAWLLPNDGTRTNHRLRRDMRRFDDADEIDLVIVGCGAGGSVLAQRLARKGWRVAALDAGPFWDPDADWVSDEAGSHHLYWTEPRVITGDDPVPMGSNNSGRGVGGFQHGHPALGHPIRSSRGPSVRSQVTAASVCGVSSLTSPQNRGPWFM